MLHKSVVALDPGGQAFVCFSTPYPNCSAVDLCLALKRHLLSIIFIPEKKGKILGNVSIFLNDKIIIYSFKNC